MSTRVLIALAGVLLLVRLPSLVQPMGPDEGLYAYVGERILDGGLPYRDAWDQKPPGIHYIYAGFRAIWPHDSVVDAADLLAAALVALALWTLGTRLHGPATGGAAAVIFLLLSDPGFTRYGGVRVRAQCETFIALFTAAAVAAVYAPGKGAQRTARLFAAGVLVGAVFALKYNAGLYGIVVLAAIAVSSRLTARDLLSVFGGALVVPAAFLIVFVRGNALNDLYQATVAYNVQYSGETYGSMWAVAKYGFTFPIEHARIDGLWFLGGLGCLALLVAAMRRRTAILPVLWVATSCSVILINGSRGLPQYFVQAGPALALAAAVGGALALERVSKPMSWAVLIVLSYGVWRVNDFPKLAANVAHDVRYIAGQIDRRALLARYGGLRDVDKYSAIDNVDLGRILAARTRPDQTVFVFGFSPGAYVYADRRSASRFFWSRPVIVGFDAAEPGYGVNGLLGDLERNQPAVVVLQHHDWWPDVQDSEAFFLGQSRLSGWLHAHYRRFDSIDGFSTWERVQ